MVLDEPTNDLDLETLELLQERLADYNGTVLLVSHDRDFLDRVVTSVIATEGDGRWIEYAGGYSDMLLQRGPAKPTGVSGGRSRGSRDDAVSKQQTRKLSFKDKHALETLPGRMEAFGNDIARLNRVLADADLYRRQPAKFADATKALQAAETALATAEEQWKQSRAPDHRHTGHCFPIRRKSVIVLHNGGHANDAELTDARKPPTGRPRPRAAPTAETAGRRGQPAP
jgi:ATP-binding cassette subfamily F protein uup